MATNGAGSATSMQSFLVAAASALVVSPSSEAAAFETSSPGRRRAPLDIAGVGAVWLRLTSTASSETTLFLRFLDAGGNLVEERRLAVPAGGQVLNDLGGYGLRGTFLLELVGDAGVSASIVRTGRFTKEIRR